jgi:hypothetical protein
MKCEDCRFWSERLAQAVGGGPVEAYCLVEGGPFSGRYTAGSQGCDKGQSNQYGAVDDPYEDYDELQRLYAADDEKEASRALAEDTFGRIERSNAAQDAFARR